MTDAIKLRKQLKSKKPKFRMTGFGVRKRVKDRWRHAGGSDNKIRHGFKGYPKKVKIGYRSPNVVRGFHPSGVQIINVNNVKELGGIDPKAYGIYISRNVGKKKKVEIINKCMELGITVLNFKAEEYIKKINDEIAAKKEIKKKKTEEKDKKNKEKEKKAAEKEKKEESKEGKSEEGLAEKIEEVKEKEEQEKKKVLTKKE